jgi:hypothetical protein
MILKLEISVEQARHIAEEQALMNLSGVVTTKAPLLLPFYLEADNCWMFFRNKEIALPPESQLGIEWAYVVSKHGKFCLVEDFSSNDKKLLDYVKKMSDYFARTEAD